MQFVNVNYIIIPYDISFLSSFNNFSLNIYPLDYQILKHYNTNTYLKKPLLRIVPYCLLVPA